MALSSDQLLLIIALLGSIGIVLLAARRQLPSRWFGPSILLVHVGLALGYHFVLGLNLTTDLVTGGFIQFAPWPALRHDLFHTLWYFHTQPPLFNVYALWLSLLHPQDPSWAMQLANIVLGGLICLLSYRVIRLLTDHALFSLVIGLIFALSHALLLYETYLLSDVLVLFILVMGAWLLAAYQQGSGWRYLAGLILAVNGLILTRSAYQWVILLPMLTLVIMLAGPYWRRVALVGMLISSMTMGWYIKNMVLFDFWGTSSWYGLNLWRAVSNNYTQEELLQFQQKGLLDEFIVDGRHSFSHPSTYADYPQFATASDNPMLNQGDFNNLSVILVSKHYFAASQRLIRHDPKHYWANVRLAYRQFSCPSANFGDLAPNFERIPDHWRWGNNLLYGRGLMITLGLHKSYCTWDYALLPFSLLAVGLPAMIQNRMSWRRWRQWIHQEAVMIYLSFMLLYSTLAGILLEYGETVRFSFASEYLTWLLASVLLYRGIKMIRPPREQ